MKETAVELLVKELNKMIDFIPMDKWGKIRDIVQQAKEMEKQQIIYAHISGVQLISIKTRYHYNDALEYYNETFKNETK